MPSNLSADNLEVASRKGVLDCKIATPNRYKKSNHSCTRRSYSGYFLLSFAFNCKMTILCFQALRVSIQFYSFFDILDDELPPAPPPPVEEVFTLLFLFIISSLQVMFLMKLGTSVLLTGICHFIDHFFVNV